MIVCEFCLQYKPDGECGLGLKIPKSMTCREFGPTWRSFALTPKTSSIPNRSCRWLLTSESKGRN